ncbi:hypothetical protein KIN20_026471 [Parelaphostrongylus tenuis]|uniref:Uncharacterized protein n=1 Tax=Parelaphostrongylus tenuis TaxID=148309 RepID=A0AAD5QY67_PARTN|nr:hypothetical protein KIN20_026471 [Parelaphostrongylus tenuis]
MSDDRSEWDNGGCDDDDGEDDGGNDDDSDVDKVSIVSVEEIDRGAKQARKTRISLELRADSTPPPPPLTHPSPPTTPANQPPPPTQRRIKPGMLVIMFSDRWRWRWRWRWRKRRRRRRRRRGNGNGISQRHRSLRNDDTIHIRVRQGKSIQFNRFTDLYF